MWYAVEYEITHLHSSPHGHRTPGVDRGPALLGCLCLAPLPDSAGQQPRRASPTDCRPSGCDDQTVLDALHAFNAHGLDALQKGLFWPKHTPLCLRSRASRAVTGFAPSAAARLWISNQCVDPGISRPGQCGPRASHDPRQRRRTSARRCCAWGRAGNGPSTGLPAPIRSTAEKKSRRDRLIQSATQHPDWPARLCRRGVGTRQEQPHLPAHLD